MHCMYSSYLIHGQMRLQNLLDLFLLLKLHSFIRPIFFHVSGLMQILWWNLYNYAKPRGVYSSSTIVLPSNVLDCISDKSLKNENKWMIKIV